MNIKKTMSDQEILGIICERLKAQRLRLDLTREQVALHTGKSANTIRNAETGNCTLETLIALLRCYRALENLNSLVPEPLLDPLMMVKRQTPRQRASGSRKK